MFKFIVVLAYAFGMLSGSVQAQTKEKTNNWLVDAPDDIERLKRIENMFAGFSTSMVDVGRRFDNTYAAIIDGNHELAEYHWKKIRHAIETGYLRRPAREANAVKLFLSGPYKNMLSALENGDPAMVRASFLIARDACKECHESEKVPFMNNQPLFRRTASFP